MGDIEKSESVRILVPLEQQKVERIQRLAKTIYYYDQWPRTRNQYRNTLSKNAWSKFPYSHLSPELQQAELDRIEDSRLDELSEQDKAFKRDYQIYINIQNEFDKMAQLSIKLVKEIIAFNGGKFPNNLEHGSDVVTSCYLVFQHSDRDLPFMKYGLEKLVEVRQENFQNISPVFLMHLTDRYCLRHFGYQFFGTQDMGKEVMPENTLQLPYSFAEMLANPHLFLELIKENLPDYKRTPPAYSDVLKLWQTAKTDADKVYEDRTRCKQDSAIEKFIKRYSTESST